MGKTNNITTTNPTYVKYMLPQYGLGSWLQENAGTVGTIAGAGLGMLIGNPMLGASIGGQAGSIIQNGYMQDQQQIEADKQQSITQAVNQYQAQPNPMYGANFANGGSLNFKSPAAYKAWLAYGHASGEFAKTPGNQKVSIKGQPKKVQHAYGGIIDSFACGGKMKADGGMLEATKNLDNVTYYGGNVRHETSPVGGIKLGTKGLVESGEIRYGDYIFSSRF